MATETPLLAQRRTWVAIGIWGLALTELAMRALVPDLRADETLKNITIATFTSGVFAVVGFDFGSSSGSEDKTKMLSDQLDKQG